MKIKYTFYNRKIRTNNLESQSSIYLRKPQSLFELLQKPVKGKGQETEYH